MYVIKSSLQELGLITSSYPESNLMVESMYHAWPADVLAAGPEFPLRRRRSPKSL